MNFLCTLLLFLNLSACKDSPPREIPVPDVDISVPNSPSGEPPIIEPDPATLPPTPEPPKPEPVVIAPLPSEVVPSLSLSGVKLVGATAAQEAKYKKALIVVAKVLKDPEFKRRVLAHRDFENTTDSQATVYRKLYEGSETYKAPQKDFDADLEVRFYYANNSTVGYTYPKVGYIMVNTKFFNSYTASSVAANFIHEYLHKLGYGHDSSATARRPYSVPYGIGGIMRSVGKKYE